MHQSLSDAKLAPRDISKVMLVGGATRTPLVQRLLQARLGLEPRFEINPDLIVAMGAAIQGGVLAGQKRAAVLVDITPHTFSTEAVVMDEFLDRTHCVPIIRRNTPLPASKAELFATVIDNQREVRVRVYQGESSAPEDNLLIGEFLVENLADVPMGNQVILSFDLDLNGMLKVTATEKATGLAKSVSLDIRGAHTLDLAQARRNIASLLGDATEAAEETGPDGGEVSTHPEAVASAKELRKRAEALLQKNPNPEDAEEIRRLLQQSAEAVRTGASDRLAEVNNTLSDLLFYLED
jgi:molecular chaperone DnaK